MTKSEKNAIELKVDVINFCKMTLQRQIDSGLLNSLEEKVGYKMFNQDKKLSSIGERFLSKKGFISINSRDAVGFISRDYEATYRLRLSVLGQVVFLEIIVQEYKDNTKNIKTMYHKFGVSLGRTDDTSTRIDNVLSKMEVESRESLKIYKAEQVIADLEKASELKKSAKDHFRLAVNSGVDVSFDRL